MTLNEDSDVAVEIGLILKAPVSTYLFSIPISITFPQRIERICSKIKAFFLVVILLILINVSSYYVWMLFSITLYYIFTYKGKLQAP